MNLRGEARRKLRAGEPQRRGETYECAVLPCTHAVNRARTFPVADVVTANDEGPEADSLRAFIIGEKARLLCCGDDQSGLSRLGCLVLFPLDLGPSPLLSCGDLGSAFIAHAAMSTFWLCRLVAQFLAYDSALWRGNGFRTLMHAAFAMLWAT